MATGIGIIIILGLLANVGFKKIKLPGILGMLLLGIAIGPHGIDWISPEILNVSADFRMMALSIILLRAGLGLKREKLNMVGKTALKLSFIPCLMEGFAIAFLAGPLFGFTLIEGGVLGFVIAAVSPAVVVPRMLYFSENGIGTDKGIPTLILAGSSIDDVFAITLLSSFLGLYSAHTINVAVQVLNVFTAIALGMGVGTAVGLVMVWFFGTYSMRDTKKVLYVLAAALLVIALQEGLKGRIAIAGLLGIMTIGFVMVEKIPLIAGRLAVKFSKIWIFAEIFLFVLVGAQVNIYVAFNAGLIGIIIIGAGLLARSGGVLLSTAGTNLNFSERLFCVIAYWPKATVQAAVGALPLALGMPAGEIILAMAVLSIIITAPLGAIGINYSAERLLNSS